MNWPFTKLAAKASQSAKINWICVSSIRSPCQAAGQFCERIYLIKSSPFTRKICGGICGENEKMRYIKLKILKL